MADHNNSQTGNSNQTDTKSGEIKGNQPISQTERKPEQAGTDQEPKEKSAIGGGDKSQSGTQPSGQSSGQSFDKASGEIKTEEKSSTEPTGQGR